MIGSFGVSQFGSSEFVVAPILSVGGNIAVLGDTSSHGGIITTHNQDGTFDVGGIVVAVNGALHSCLIPGHGVTAITAVVVRSFHNSELIVTEGAKALCGAVIEPPDRGVSVE